MSVAADDFHEAAYPWGWWHGQQLGGDVLVLALEAQTLEPDVVAVLDAKVGVNDEGRPEAAAVLIFGPASAAWDKEQRTAFRIAEANPRFLRVLAGNAQHDGWQRLGPNHWQLHLLEPQGGPRPES